MWKWRMNWLMAMLVVQAAGAGVAQGSWDTNASGQLVGIVGPLAFDRSGQAWWVGDSSDLWHRVPNADLPVPVNDVKFLEGAIIYSSGTDPDNARLVTKGDQVWILAVPGGYHWELIGTFPGGPITVEQESAGSVKGKYRSR